MVWELVKDGKQYKCWLNLDEIEIYTEGSNKGCRNWKNSVGKKIGARYQWINDEMEERWFIIKDYINSYLILVDKNNNEFKIARISLCKGVLGKLFNKFTVEFKYNIGSEINGLKIIDREYRKNKNGQNCKYYQYQCEKCRNIDWIRESNLKKGTGCNVCGLSPRKVIKGYNDIATTNPELIKYFVNQEDAYKYSVGSGKKVLLQCPDCDHQKEMIISNLYKHGFGCNKCGNGISYPEKFTANVLTQLNIRFKTQLSKTDFEWCQNFRYDFYLPDHNTILETHGNIHYEDAFQAYEETHENDLLKYKLAASNGFEHNKNYFIIDSRKSTLEWMKENIIKELGHLYDFSNVDWEKVDLESQKSHMILACKFKRENPDLSTKEIIELIKDETGIEYSHATISNWLNRGNKLGLCHYDGKEENIKSGKKGSGKNNPRAKKVKQKDLNGNIIKIWDYAKQISEELGYDYGALLHHINGKYKGKPYKGYIWECCE